MEIKKKLLDIVRDKIRFKHYSYSTERTYVHWIKNYIVCAGHIWTPRRSACGHFEPFNRRISIS